MAILVPIGYNPPTRSEELPLVHKTGPLQPHDGPPQQQVRGVGVIPHRHYGPLTLLPGEEGTPTPVSSGGPAVPLHPLVAEVLGEALGYSENSQSQQASNRRKLSGVREAVPRQKLTCP